jgi:hypothetical protein
MELFAKWKENWLYPVSVNLSTAILLFLVMMPFERVRELFFPPREIPGYPLISRAEPYLSDSGDELIIDYFIINRSEDSHTRETLQNFLSQNNPNSQKDLSPDIKLKYTRLIGNTRIGRIESVYADTNFNDNKGNLTPIINGESNTVEIRINKIEGYAILKVIILIADLPDLGRKIDRTAYKAAPFNFEDYRDACYSR